MPGKTAAARSQFAFAAGAARVVQRPDARGECSCSRIKGAPLTAGEQWGVRWEFNKLIENHDTDYLRATRPNVGGITEYLKIAALCETHSVRLVPHFTGPIATAALVHVLAPLSGPVLTEWLVAATQHPHLSEWLAFKVGKLFANQRPGLGVITSCCA